MSSWLISSGLHWEFGSTGCALAGVSTDLIIIMALLRTLEGLPPEDFLQEELKK